VAVLSKILLTLSLSIGDVPVQCFVFKSYPFPTGGRPSFLMFLVSPSVLLGNFLVSNTSLDYDSLLPDLSNSLSPNHITFRHSLFRATGSVVR